MKSRQNAILLSYGTIFFSSSRNIEFTAMLSEFSIPRKRKEIKSNFQMVNLRNGGTKDFSELFEMIHLNI